MIDLPLTNQQAFDLRDHLRSASQWGKLRPGDSLYDIWKRLDALDEILCKVCVERPAEKAGKCNRCYMRLYRKPLTA